MNDFFGLPVEPAAERLDALAPSVAKALGGAPFLDDAYVAVIDPDLADTAALADAFGLPDEVSANCVIVSGKREGVETIAACVVLASTKADVNNFVKRHLNVRKASFLDMDRALEESTMEYGGITPIGLPAEWRLLIDRRVTESETVIIGAGVRASKVILPGGALGSLPNAELLDGLAI